MTPALPHPPAVAPQCLRLNLPHCYPHAQPRPGGERSDDSDDDNDVHSRPKKDDDDDDDEGKRKRQLDEPLGEPTAGFAATATP